MLLLSMGFGEAKQKVIYAIEDTEHYCTKFPELVRTQTMSKVSVALPCAEFLPLGSSEVHCLTALTVQSCSTGQELLGYSMVNRKCFSCHDCISLLCSHLFPTSLRSRISRKATEWLLRRTEQEISDETWRGRSNADHC